MKTNIQKNPARAGLNLSPSRFLAGRGRRGQGMTEYVIILVAIAVVCIAITVLFGGSIQEKFQLANDQLQLVTPSI